MNHKITPAKEDYIRRAVNNGRTRTDVASELKVSQPTVSRHYSGKRKAHSCVVCGDSIIRGNYCSKRKCVKVRDNQYKKSYSKSSKERIRKKEWLDSHPNYKGLGKERICTTCGRTFLHYNRRKSTMKFYCSQSCFKNRYRAASEITRKLENITVLSSVIVKEKPVVVEKVESIGSLMRKTPESQEHMRG